LKRIFVISLKGFECQLLSVKDVVAEYNSEFRLSKFLGKT
jgi:hypothetical protein